MKENIPQKGLTSQNWHSSKDCCTERKVAVLVAEDTQEPPGSVRQENAESNWRIWKVSTAAKKNLQSIQHTTQKLPRESLQAAPGVILAVIAQEKKMRWLWYPPNPFYSLMSYIQLCFTAAA